MLKRSLPFLALVLVGCGGSSSGVSPTPSVDGRLTLTDANSPGGPFVGSLAPLENLAGYGGTDENGNIRQGTLRFYIYKFDENGSPVLNGRELMLFLPSKSLVLRKTIDFPDGTANLIYGDFEGYEGDPAESYWVAESGKIEILGVQRVSPKEVHVQVRLVNVRVSRGNGPDSGGAAFLNGSIQLNVGVAPV